MPSVDLCFTSVARQHERILILATAALTRRGRWLVPFSFFVHALQEFWLLLGSQDRADLVAPLLMRLTHLRIGLLVHGLIFVVQLGKDTVQLLPLIVRQA